MSPEKSSGRLLQLHEKVREKLKTETDAELARFEERQDYRPELDYFLNLFRGDVSLAAVSGRVGQPAAALLCVQAPLELFHAFGVHPLKLGRGSQAAGQLLAPRLPALTCPMLKSVLGALELEGRTDYPFIIPATCDWVNKFSEMARLCGAASFCEAYATGNIHRMELPRLKDSLRAQNRWLGEVAALSDFLGNLSGQKLNRKKLLQTIEVYKAARQCFSRLVSLRRAGLVPALWFSIITGAFFLDRIENWTAALEKALPGFAQKLSPGADNTTGAGKVFLSGSPLFFPNFKLLHILEEAGLVVIGDDMCSSERIFPSSLAVDDPSEDGLLRALAESYHQGCLCPVFAGNDRRINNIWGALDSAGFQGVIFHVLKGCHPYDLESFELEIPVKEKGLRFLKIETDYSAEDSQNILTRLEAFHKTMRTK